MSRFRKKHKDPPLEGNELLVRWRTNRATLPADFPRLLDPMLDGERRGDLFEAEDEDAQEKYAWAIPDERALKICAAFSPLVEIGAGAGYWARLLRDMGVVVHAFDCDVGDKTRAAGVLAPAWTSVEKGGPEKLTRHKKAALLLLYPDDLSPGGHREDEEEQDAEPEQLSTACLRAYEGDTVIHVGEWLGDTLTLSMEGQDMPDNLYPWGRSTSAEFQILLTATFHKVLQVPLPNWGSVRNTLTVWKRTTSAVIAGDRYAYVPAEERLEVEAAAPMLKHLLST